MCMIREFENARQHQELGRYQGIEYKHMGPAHLSIGQEGALWARPST